ncbi:amidase family protein [Terribacillus sp. 7520-G]|uniref:amidase family protein n=1 Tax=Terribacillus TaxID=459532 RepID=UPI000BA636D8|nr:amidase family protein [Terribacillus sp. 7520-G]PAD38856.1 amidase [Terribacillus sp. 7520-G]
MNTFPFEEATISSLQNDLTAGKLTSTALVEAYLERIAKKDSVQGGTNSVLEVNPDALFLAGQMDKERKEEQLRGPLHGIPVLIKDNIDTADGMHTSAGTLVLADNYAKQDAFIVRKLREAGAIILGKVNMTEWANFMSEPMPNGYSARGGQVRNPYGSFDVGGSSSGTGAAIADNLAAAGIGTETSGSILSPSSSNSLVGIKPTVGLVSRNGIIPIAHSQDTAGPMTRSVEDAAILLQVIAGKDESDPATLSAPVLPDYTASLQKEGLQGKRLGIDGHTLNSLSPEKRELMEKAFMVLRTQGAELIHVQVPEITRESSVLYHEFKHGVNRYLRTVSPHLPAHTLKEVIEWNRINTESALIHGQDILEAAEKTDGTLKQAEYLRDRLADIRESRTEGLDPVMSDAGLDAVIFPSYHGCDIAAKAGYPSITVPAGYTETGEPFGITFTAGAFEETTLIEIGYGYECATKHRKAPK